MKNTQVTLTCTICGSEYKSQLNRAATSKFCSRECWQKRNPPISRACPVCNSTFTTYHRDQVFCCCSCARRGTPGNAYKDGRSMERERARDGVELKQWREAVYRRDNYTCQHCGKRNTYLHAHHVKHYADYPELRFDTNNGITLCVDCHEAIHGRKLAGPGKYPKRCADCGKPTKGRSFRCRSCAARKGYVNHWATTSAQGPSEKDAPA